MYYAQKATTYKLIKNMFFHHHKFIFFPVFLIFIGVLALLINLGVITATIWSWWPILFVILGIYLLIWQNRKKRIIKGLVWYGAINKFIKSEKIEKLLENKSVQKELKKVGDIVEGVIGDQIDKLHKKYGAEETTQEEEPEIPEEQEEL